MTPRLVPLLARATAQPEGTFWLPEAASSEAGEFDQLFYFLFYLSLFFFILIVGAIVLFAVKYRRRKANQRTSAIEGHRGLEIVWAIIPAILLVVIFLWGFRGFLSYSVAPRDALEVRVTAQKWSWTFDYPSLGISSGDLVVPVDRPVKLTMSSVDVIHSFYVPAFRIKRDVLPNRYTVMWFTPEETGDYDVLCAEYCGTAHSTMLAKVEVKSEAAFQRWVDSGGGLGGEGISSVELGKRLFKLKGCATCHSVDGTKKIGPSMLGKYGATEQLADGSSVKVDDNYLRESIMEPNARVAQGYEPVMPTYAGRLEDKELNALIDYIKSIGK